MSAVQKPERKRATVLFADLVGFTALSERLGPEQAYLIVTGCLRLLDGSARRHGGSVDKYLGDCLMAVFGYPVPLENAARAAQQAALEMRRRVDAYNQELDLELPLGLVVGINTGWMVAGDISGPVIREFHVLGDAVNVAARLKARAPTGRIYVGPETRADGDDWFETRALEPMALKGKAQPVPTFELVGPRARARSEADCGSVEAEAISSDPWAQSELVGRLVELDRLREFVRELAAGRGGVLALVGEEGIGKSRLLAELARSEELEKVDGIFARAELDPGALDPEKLREKARRRPQLVVVDDLDSADAALLGRVESLVEGTDDERIGLLLASRPDFLERESRFGEWVRGRQNLVRLTPLDPGESRALAERILGRGLPDETWALVDHRAKGVPGRIVMATFLSPALRSEADGSRSGPQRSSDAERRRATILFADITGFTAMTEKLGPERAYPVVAGCLRLLDEVARKHGGTVDKYLGDCVMALFGVPEAIEDAPRAALNAAIEMRRRVREYNEEQNLELPLDVHTGINTGLGIAGDISGPLIREFAVMGDPVSLADQLKDLAPAGSIYVGGEAQRFTGEVFEFRPLEPVRLKGSAEPVPAFELLSQEERLYRARIGSERKIFSPLVGREEELERLRSAVRGLSAGSGAVTSVIAEAGIGKSRLIAELENSEETSDCVWLEGRSLSTGQQLSFHPFADLCRSWARISDDNDDDEVRRKVEGLAREIVPEQVAEVFPFVATLMGIRLVGESADRLARIQADALEKMIRRSLTLLLSRQSERRPVVVVLDDLHWADQSSVELFESLVRLIEDHPILFLLMARPGFASASQRAIDFVRTHHAARHEEIQLAPLDARAARRMIGHLFSEGDIPRETRRLIEDKSQGNPFYIEEVIRSLVDQGAVERREDGFRADPKKIHSVVIPGTVQEVIMARVDRLDLDKRRLLQVASVVGGSFQERVLGGVEGDADLAVKIQALLDAEFIVPWDQSQGVEYAFKHPLIQEVVYDGLLEAKREEMHRAVARAMEARLPEELPGIQGMLAYHFSKGRDAERAESHLFRAGDEAARAAGSSEALTFFRDASQLYFDLHGEGGDPAKKAQLQRNIARALHFRGQLVEAVEAFNRAIDFLGESVPRRQPALALRFVLNLTGALARLYVRAARRPPATDVQREVIDLMYQRGLCEVTADATRFLFDSIAMLDRLSRVAPESVPGAGGLYAASSVIFSYGGISFGIGRRLLEIADRCVDEKDISELILYRMMSSTHHFFAGDWSDSHDIPDALLSAGLEVGKTWEVLSYLTVYMEKRISQGDFQAARRYLALNDRIWDQYQNDLARSQHHYFSTLLMLEERRLEQALDAAREYYDENPENPLHIHALAFRAKAETLLGDLEAADATLERCAQVVAEEGRLTVPQFMMSQYLRSRLLADVAALDRAVRAGDPATRRVRLHQARRSARRALRSVGWVSGRKPEVYRYVGQMHWLAGAQRTALKWWQKSLDAGIELGTRPEIARTCLAAGRSLREAGVAASLPDGSDSATCLVRARRIFEELGLGWDLAELERVPEGRRRRA